VSTQTSTTSSPASVIRSLAANAAAIPKAIAIRHKRRGIWNEITWSELQDTVTQTALGLRRLGVTAGSTVALFAENGPDWVVADLAIQRLGARVLPVLPQTSAADITAWFVANDVTVAFCGDEEHVDKLIDAAPQGLASLVVFDMTGLARHPDGRLTPFADVTGAGVASEGIVDPESASSLRAETNDQVIAIDVSRADGSLASVMDVHAGEVEQSAAGVAQWLGLTPADRTISIMPLADIVTRTLDVYAPIHAAAQMHFVETTVSVLEDMVEVSPTILTGSRQVYDLIRREAFVQQLRTGRARRRMIGWAIGSVEGKQPSGFGRWARRVLVSRPMSLRHGVIKVRKAVVIGEDSLAKGTAQFFAALKVPLSSVWGAPEFGGPVLAFDGRSADVVTLSPVATAIGAQTATDSTTLRAGSWRDGVTGTWASTTAARVEAALEHVLREQTYVSRAVVHQAAGAGYSAIIELDFETVSAWANQHSVDFTTRRSIAENEAVRTLIGGEIARLNATSAQKIVDFGIAPRAFTVANGDLAPALWVQRDVVATAYSDTVRPVTA
jgi:long-chain acyl-CoA synthetase